MPTGANPARYTINGVLDTNNTALENMESLSTASGSWMTYDAKAGQWSVVINRPGISIMSFDNSNILSTIEISGTGLTDLYNKVKVTFPHVDLDDQLDFVTVSIPSQDLNPNEPPNTLDINFNIVNDPVQAELLGFQELKQSRVDRVISFETDYSAISLKAGDVFDVTNTVFAYTNKLFRITSITETEDEAGAIRLRLTGLEYADNVYNPDDLFRFTRENENGIITIGSIDTPTAPTITRFQQDVRPRIVLQATTPAGIVDGMQFWLSQTSSSTGFELLGTAAPAGGGSYASGTSVLLDVDFVNTGNVFAKVRAVNSNTSSQFSAVQSDTFSPKQITQATNTGTQVLDSSGNNILSTLSLSALLALLNGLLANNQTGAGTMWDQIFDLFASTTGSDIRTGQVPGVGVPVANAFASVQVAGQSTVAATGEDFFTLVAGNNIAITTNASTDAITITSNAVSTTGNLIVGPGGSTVSVPLGGNVRLVGNVVSGIAGGYTDVLIGISGNLATDPDQVRFSATPASATQMWIQQGQTTRSGGPFALDAFSFPVANAVSNANAIYCNLVFNWLYTGPGIVDGLKRVRANLKINGNVVASTADSSSFDDAYANQVLAIAYGGNISAMDQVQLDCSIESEEATGCTIDIIIQQPFTTDLDD